ncbi:hypothetical protein F2P45_11335 [Massilia sp. CCM 8733]|uniref:Uncharacterized protein n=1 Tax=Massilia mucilaginosa TaxID=2609282 RepID=A0ABX0NRW4_9BURK|nr:erythromycin esterase family protein [Massilia mucilaginosa]NHZ89603.1 hypothetical protein [Massilia mucilaginosa]
MFSAASPFANAIGNARVVAPGEQTHGAREAYLRKTRLLKFQRTFGRCFSNMQRTPRSITPLEAPSLAARIVHDTHAIRLASLRTVPCRAVNDTIPALAGEHGQFCRKGVRAGTWRLHRACFRGVAYDAAVLAHFARAPGQDSAGAASYTGPVSTFARVWAYRRQPIDGKLEELLAPLFLITHSGAQFIWLRLSQ